MKKTVSLLLCIILVLSCSVTSFAYEMGLIVWSQVTDSLDNYEAFEENRKGFAECRAGDINGDGFVTSADARLCLRAACKLDRLAYYAEKAADINGDDKVTSADARLILRNVAKMDTLESNKVSTSTWEGFVVGPFDVSSSKNCNWICSGDTKDFQIDPVVFDGENGESVIYFVIIAKNDVKDFDQRLLDFTCVDNDDSSKIITEFSLDVTID